MLEYLINKLKQLILYLCVLEIVSPQRSDFVLAAHIPHGETDVFVFYSLHIKTWREPIATLKYGKLLGGPLNVTTD